jgi:hypothetical protein
MRLKLELDQETADALNQAAEREFRYPHQQAEALLRQVLGLPFPIPHQAPSEDQATPAAEVANVR